MNLSMFRILVTVDEPGHSRGVLIPRPGHNDVTLEVTRTSPHDYDGTNECYVCGGVISEYEPGWKVVCGYTYYHNKCIIEVPSKRMQFVRHDHDVTKGANMLAYKVVDAFHARLNGMWTFMRGSSCTAPAMGEVRYEIGVKTVPKPGCGPLACFGSLDYAIQFASGLNYAMDVLLCDVGLSNESTLWIDDESSKLRRLLSSAHVPMGTVFCDWVMPIEVVQDWRSMCEGVRIW